MNKVGIELTKDDLLMFADDRSPTVIRLATFALKQMAILDGAQSVIRGQRAELTALHTIADAWRNLDDRDCRCADCRAAEKALRALDALEKREEQLRRQNR
jgi:hypothetical protein